MTNLQKLLVKFVDDNFYSGTVTTQVSGDTVKVTDKKGESIVFTIDTNDIRYYDVINANTRQIYARYKKHFIINLHFDNQFNI